MSEKQGNARALIEALSQGCRTLAEASAKLKELFGGMQEKMMEAKLDEHLGYEKHSPKGKNSGNSRNGHGRKTMKKEWGETDISVPRDRNSSFEPQIVEKRQTRTDDIENRILAMYSKGMSTWDIEDHLRDIYGAEASSSLISQITDKVMPLVSEWQNRPLDAVYPIVFLDGIVFRRKEILGMWTSENDSASFWASICNELKNRGVSDILIACRDNLSGFSQVIEAAFPHTEQFQISRRSETAYLHDQRRRGLSPDAAQVHKNQGCLSDQRRGKEVRLSIHSENRPQVDDAYP